MFMFNIIWRQLMINRIYTPTPPSSQASAASTSQPVGWDGTALYAYLLKTFANPGCKILDTHLGSGRHLIAAYRYGADFYATEISREYFEKQEERFRKACFGEVKTKEGAYVQQSLFE